MKRDAERLDHGLAEPSRRNGGSRSIGQSSRGELGESPKRGTARRRRKSVKGLHAYNRHCSEVKTTKGLRHVVYSTIADSRANRGLSLDVVKREMRMRYGQGLTGSQNHDRLSDVLSKLIKDGKLRQTADVYSLVPPKSRRSPPTHSRIRSPNGGRLSPRKGHASKRRHKSRSRSRSRSRRRRERRSRSRSSRSASRHRRNKVRRSSRGSSGSRSTYLTRMHDRRRRVHRLLRRRRRSRSGSRSSRSGFCRYKRRRKRRRLGKSGSAKRRKRGRRKRGKSLRSFWKFMLAWKKKKKPTRRKRKMRRKIGRRAASKSKPTSKRRIKRRRVRRKSALSGSGSKSRSISRRKTMPTTRELLRRALRPKFRRERKREFGRARGESPLRNSLSRAWRSISAKRRALTKNRFRYPLRTNPITARTPGGRRKKLLRPKKAGTISRFKLKRNTRRRTSAYSKGLTFDSILRRNRKKRIRKKSGSSPSKSKRAPKRAASRAPSRASSTMGAPPGQDGGPRPTFDPRETPSPRSHDGSTRASVHPPPGPGLVATHQ